MKTETPTCLRSELSCGRGVYPCVILSRCFWQHTSKTHTERALIAHRWTQVSSLYVSSCESFTRFRTGPRDVAAPLKRSQDAELCNELDTYTVVSARRTAERRTGTGGETHGAAAARRVCAPIRRTILLTHSFSPGTLRGGQNASAQRLETPSGDARGRSDSP